MSCVLRTITPFISKEILLEALEKCGYEYNIKGGNIYIPAVCTYFQFKNGKYILIHDDLNFLINSFLVKVAKSYNNIYERKLKRLEEIKMEKEKVEKLKKQESERLEKQRLKEEVERLERERIAYIESQKKAIMEKAKAKGYRVVEVKKENKVQLTLVREIR